MNFGAILPHTLLFGGVKHYLEVAETVIKRGHRFTIFTPDSIAPNWCNFSGDIKLLSDISDSSLDVLITSEEVFLPELTSSLATNKIFYVINENRSLPQIAKYKSIIFLANSARSVRHVKNKINQIPFKATCGINVNDFYPRHEEPPKDPFVVLTYGRQSMKLKGTHLVKKACEILYKQGYNIKLLLFDTITSEKIKSDIDSFSSSCPFEFVVNHPVKKNNELYYRAHVFASAERKGTWANTASEAMACGVAVVASSVGSDDFLFNNETGLKVRRTVGAIARALKKLYKDDSLRHRLAKEGAKQVTKWQWQISADQIIALCEQPNPQKVAFTTWPFVPNLLQRVKLPKVRQSISGELPVGLYIFNYHAIIDRESKIESWEENLTESVTSFANFKSHIKWLMQNASAISLLEVPELIKRGINKPYFVITFDDGFKDIYNTVPLLEEYGIIPTIFINSDIIDTAETSEQFLDWGDIRKLSKNGWLIGNHTKSHAALQGISFAEQQDEIEYVIKRCKDEFVPLIPWIAFPYGLSNNVNGATLNWMNSHQEWSGLFANGGYNIKPHRTEYLRMGVPDISLIQFKEMVSESIEKMQKLQFYLR